MIKKMLNDASLDQTQTLFDISELAQKASHSDIFLTPNHRLARYVKRSWEKRLLFLGETSWKRIEAFHWESWLVQIWREEVKNGNIEPQTLLAAPLEKEIWRKIILSDLKDAPSFSLIDIGATIEKAVRARKTIKNYKVDVFTSAIKPFFLVENDCSCYLKWLSQFNQHLKENGLITMEDAFHALSNSSINSLSGLNVYLVEFEHPPPILISFLREFGLNIHEYKKMSSSCDLSLVSYTSFQKELQAVAKWAFDKYQEDDFSTIGIVIDDIEIRRMQIEHVLRREFGYLSDSYTTLPINFSTLISLDRAPMIRDAFKILNLLGDGIPVNEFLSLVQSRFLSIFPDAFEFLYQLSKVLAKTSFELIKIEHLTELVEGFDKNEEWIAEDLLIRAQQVLVRNDLQRKRLPSLWVPLLCEVLDHWGWPGQGPPDTLESRQYKQWIDAIENISGYDASLGQQSLCDLISLLERHCKSVPFQTETKGERIHVLGRLEAAGLTFDELWITSVESRNWPILKKRNPFIPVSIQDSLNIFDMDSDSDYLLNNYIRCNGKINSSYTSSNDGVRNRPSSSLNLAKIKTDDELWIEPLSWKEAKNNLFLKQDIDEIPKVSDIELPTIKGGTRIVEDQSVCGIKAFLSHRCGLKSHTPCSIGLSSLEKGKLLHSVLFRFWGRVRNQMILKSFSARELDKIVNSSIQGALRELKKLRRGEIYRVFLHWEYERLYHLLMEWISYEKDREPFSVISIEERFNVKFSNINLEFSVDRIDRLDNGNHLLIDYKSSAQKLSSWFGDFLEKPQLPFYAVNLEKIDGIAFAEVRKGECRLNGLMRTNGNVEVKSIENTTRNRVDAERIWEKQLSIWKEKIDSIINDFVLGKLSSPITKSGCRECIYRSVCRVQANG